MTEIIINDGKEEISLNGVVSVRLNLSDPATVERMYNAFSGLEKKQEDYRASVSAEEDNAAVFALCRKMDADMRGIINEVLETDVCTPLFGRTSVYALSGGLPLWVNLMLGIIDRMREVHDEQQKMTNPAIEKYMKKYHR